MESSSVFLVIALFAIPSYATPTFIVHDSNKTCLMVQSDITLDLTYGNTVGTIKKLNSTISGNATTVGSCTKIQDRLLINWFADAPQDYDFTLTLSFNKSNAEQFLLTSMSLAGDISESDVKLNVSAIFHSFTTDVGKSYNCTKPTRLTMSAENITASLLFTNLRIEAFKASDEKNPKFNAVGSDCSPLNSVTDAIVPIAVGAALAGMVIFVLIGYCIGRRRTRAGYQNMNA